jgi:dipeptidyl aminopeptidase/acylaminoacyl peptidase
MILSVFIERQVPRPILRRPTMRVLSGWFRATRGRLLAATGLSLYPSLCPAHAVPLTLTDSVEKHPLATGDPIADLPGFVLPAIDTVIALGIADSSRVGVLGQSHGAIAVYGLLTETTRFRAGIALSGWPDLVHYEGAFAANYCFCGPDFSNEMLTTGPPQFEAANDHSRPDFAGLHIGPTPWADPARWLRNNPIYHFDRVETPLLIVWGDNDVVYMSNGDEAFQLLHRLGRRVRYVRYWGEGHTIESPANIRDLWARMDAWFAEYLRGH